MLKKTDLATTQGDQLFTLPLISDFSNVASAAALARHPRVPVVKGEGVMTSLGPQAHRRWCRWCHDYVDHQKSRVEVHHYSSSTLAFDFEHKGILRDDS